jgi:phage shock protein A
MSNVHIRNKKQLAEALEEAMAILTKFQQQGYHNVADMLADIAKVREKANAALKGNE